MSGLTWADVKARSLVRTQTGLEFYCGDCYIAFHHGGLPCRKHATPEESEAIDRALAAELERIADHPLVKHINGIVGWDE